MPISLCDAILSGSAGPPGAESSAPSQEQPQPAPPTMTYGVENVTQAELDWLTTLSYVTSPTPSDEMLRSWSYLPYGYPPTLECDNEKQSPWGEITMPILQLWKIAQCNSLEQQSTATFDDAGVLLQCLRSKTPWSTLEAQIQSRGKL